MTLASLRRFTVWVICGLQACSSTFESHGEQEFLNLLLDAWATTGSCDASRFRGRCGAIAALHTPDGAKPGPLLAQAAAGADPSPNASAVFDPDTLFEVASNTKVFTAVVFQRLVVEGRLSNTDTLGSLLPTLTFRNESVASITLQELVTHTSGLPKLPPNMHCAGCSNPFTGYTSQDLYDCLEDTETLPKRGKFLYSNLGFGLLGHLLELKENKPYEQLVNEKLFVPLGMINTKIVMTESDWQATAIGLNSSGGFAERLGPYGVLKGQGAFHSSARDMALFLAANLVAATGQSSALPQELAKALRLAAEPVVADEFIAEHGEVASGWQAYLASSSTTVWKSGGTSGYGSFMAFNAQSGRAAVAMESCGNCGAKAVDQLVRLLVDEPPRDLPPMPAPPTSELLPYTGCFVLPATANKNRQPHRNASLVSISLVQTKLKVEIDGSGGASLIPFKVKEGAAATKFAFAFDQQDDSVCLRPSGRGPLELASMQFGRRELYFLSADGLTLDMLAIHVDGWDLFATRIACPEIGEISEVPLNVVL